MTRVIMVTVCRNGSISSNSVPVWSEAADERLSGGAVTRVIMVTVCRNGSVSRDSVPVWKEAAGEKVCFGKCGHSYPSS